METTETTYKAHDTTTRSVSRTPLFCFVLDYFQRFSLSFGIQYNNTSVKKIKIQVKKYLFLS